VQKPWHTATRTLAGTIHTVVGHRLIIATTTGEGSHIETLQYLKPMLARLSHRQLLGATLNLDGLVVSIGRGEVGKQALMGDGAVCLDYTDPPLTLLYGIGARHATS